MTSNPRSVLAEPAATAQAARQRWLAVLARAGGAELRAAFEQALPGRQAPGYEVLRAPEVGMVMLRGRVGACGGAFNVGEATVTRCTVRLADDTLGAGYALGRDRRKAELIALCDALLQKDPALGQRLVDPLAALQAERRRERSRTAAATRVEFFTVVRGA